jgi:hypothetical protein
VIRLIRIAIWLIVPALFWAGSYVLPAIFKSENLRYLATVITFLWGLDLIFIQKMASLTNMDVLSSRALDNLDLRFANIRRRIWRMTAITFICSLMIWLIAGTTLIKNFHVESLVIGWLFSICISYVVVFPFWFDEFQAFQDKLKISAAEKLKQDGELKQLADAAK